jgi:predicted signal transduction protein with EAL and GGDEF domain
LLPWLARNNPLLESVWLSVLSFEALLFTIAIAFILLAMAKERAEHRHKTAAMIDPLTGISNRRAFLEEGEEHLARQVNDARPTAVMLLDLDNFKLINDRHGHAIGDRVLDICRSGEQLSAAHRPVRPLRRRRVRGAPA